MYEAILEDYGGNIDNMMSANIANKELISKGSRRKTG